MQRIPSFMLPTAVRADLIISYVCKDLVHHSTNVVLGKVYQEAGRNPRSLKYMHIWSDNCASQVKCANTFGWASRYLQIGKLIAVVSAFSCPFPTQFKYVTQVPSLCLCSSASQLFCCGTRERPLRWGEWNFERSSCGRVQDRHFT